MRDPCPHRNNQFGRCELGRQCECGDDVAETCRLLRGLAHHEHHDTSIGRDAAALLDALARALQRIAKVPCEDGTVRFRGGAEITLMCSYMRSDEEEWCPGCIARDALGLDGGL